MAASDRTHYDVLGIARDADDSAVRRAWKLHVQAWHPDRFSDALREQAEQQTTSINEAYSVLRDSSRRAAYDCRLAADEQAARPEPARPARRHAPTFETMHRAPTAPVGSPMTMPEPQPATVSEQAAAIGRDAWMVMRLHPRMFSSVAAVVLLAFTGAFVLQAASGPTLPSTSVTVAHSAPVVADDAQLEDLADLAERAKTEADQADAELARQMQEDARIAAVEDARMAAEDAAAARQARRSAAKAPKGGSTTGASKPAPVPSGRHVVRVMPKTG
jgi:hypothetical protein